MDLGSFKYNNLHFTDDSFLDENIIGFWNEFMSDAKTVECHTSGSTGTPKDIFVQKLAMLYSAKKTADFFGLNENSLALLCLPSKFIAGRMMLVRAFVSGMKLHSVNPALNPLKNITGYSFDFAAFTPSQVIEILNDDLSAKIFSSIKNIIIGGAAIDVALENKLLKFPNNIYATYGMTETVSHIALRKIGEKTYKKISDETHLGVDEDNCLWIEDKHLTNQKLQTNDVVELLDDVYFVWLGRRDFVINSGGVKLYPEQIEEKIRAVDAWKNIEFLITKIDDIRFGERPLLLALDNIELPPLQSLSETLNKMEMPSDIKRVSRFVYTENGKLNRLETFKLIAE